MVSDVSVAVAGGGVVVEAAGGVAPGAAAPASGVVGWVGSLNSAGRPLGATPVASGRSVEPAETVTCPSGSIRIASSAPTSRRLSARSLPVISAQPDSRTSALGAEATTT